MAEANNNNNNNLPIEANNNNNNNNNNGDDNNNNNNNHLLVFRQGQLAGPIPPVNNNQTINPFRAIPPVPGQGEYGHEAIQLTEQNMLVTVRDLVARGVLQPNPVFVGIGSSWYWNDHDYNLVLSLGNDKDTLYHLRRMDCDGHMAQSEEWVFANRVGRFLEKWQCTGAWIHSVESGCAGLVLGPIYPAFGSEEQLSYQGALIDEFGSHKMSIDVFQITDVDVKPCFQEGGFPFHPWPELRARDGMHRQVCLGPPWASP